MRQHLTTGMRLALGEREWTLRYDLNAFVAIEQVTGINTLDESIWAAPSATVVRALVWAGCLHEQPDLTLEEVGAWMGLEEAPQALEAISEAYSAAVEENEGGASSAPEKKRRG